MTERRVEFSARGKTRLRPSVVERTGSSPLTDPWCSVPMANLPDHPQNALMCQHAHKRIDQCQPGCPDQAPLEIHHVANDQDDWPPDRGGDEREPPPPPENQAEQNECRNHSDSFRALPIISR